MTKPPSSPPLNSIRVFVEVARNSHVSKAANTLQISQSAVSRHLAVLEEYLGAPVVERVGRNIQLSEFGRQLSAAVGDPLDEITFAMKLMKQRRNSRAGITVRTSLPTFAFSTLIPRISAFSDAHGGISVDVLTSTTDALIRHDADVLVTRDMKLPEPMREWKLMDETVVGVCANELKNKVTLDQIGHVPINIVTSRPDILPNWLLAMQLKEEDIHFGARYDHHYLAIPATIAGQGILIAPKIVVMDYVKQAHLSIVEGSEAATGMTYSAFASDRAANVELSQNFCKWLISVCRRDL